jgi:hypothetical protein
MQIIKYSFSEAGIPLGLSKKIPSTIDRDNNIKYINTDYTGTDIKNNTAGGVD